MNGMNDVSAGEFARAEAGDNREEIKKLEKRVNDLEKLVLYLQEELSKKMDDPDRYKDLGSPYDASRGGAVLMKNKRRR